MSERIKIEIGSAAPLDEPMTMQVSGRSKTSGLPETITIDDAFVRQAISQPVNAILQAVRRTLEKTPPQLVEDIAERGILLVGGGALIRNIDRAISQTTSLHVELDEDPLTTCVRGAGRILENMKRYSNVFIS